MLSVMETMNTDSQIGVQPNFTCAPRTVDPWLNLGLDKFGHPEVEEAARRNQALFSV